MVVALSHDVPPFNSVYLDNQPWGLDRKSRRGCTRHDRDSSTHIYIGFRMLGRCNVSVFFSFSTMKIQNYKIIVPEYTEK